VETFRFFYGTLGFRGTHFGKRCSNATFLFLRGAIQSLIPLPGHLLFFAKFFRFITAMAPISCLFAQSTKFKLWFFHSK